MTRLKSYDEEVEESAYLMIRPDHVAPSATDSMDWRCRHRGIAITNGTEIRLSDNLSVGRHLHVREGVQVARHKIRVERERKEREGPSISTRSRTRSSSSPSPSLSSSSRPPIGD